MHTISIMVASIKAKIMSTISVNMIYSIRARIISTLSEYDV